MRKKVEIAEDHPDIFTDDINVCLGSVKGHSRSVILSLVYFFKRFKTLRRKVDLRRTRWSMIYTRKPHLLRRENFVEKDAF